MAKEIPYFKFYIGDWSNGDITLESFELQGIFINVCAYYWSKDCSVTIENVKKKFRAVSESIDELIKCNCIKVIGESCSISFLNEQMDSKEVQKAINRNNGSKGGRPPIIKTENKPNGLIFDNPNITNIEKSKEEKILSKDSDIKKRREFFKDELSTYLKIYDKDMLNAFFKHWVEMNKSKTKMKFEMEKTWELNLRLSKWKSNDFGSKSNSRYKSPEPINHLELNG